MADNDDTAALDKKRPAEDPAPAAKASDETPSAADHNPKSKKIKRKHRMKDPVLFEFRKTIQMSCRNNDLGRALKAFHEAKQKGIKIEAQIYYSLLALCDGLKDEPLHIGVPRENMRRKKTPAVTDLGVKKDASSNANAKEGTNPEPKAQLKDDDDVGDKSTRQAKVNNEEIPLEERKRLAFEIKAEMDKERIPLTEAAYTSVIKLLSRAGELEHAHNTLLEAEKVQQCKVKLRLYSSLLQAYAEGGRIMDALRIWDRLVEQDIMVSEKEYLAMIRSAVMWQNATLMESVLTDLAEDAPVPSRVTNEAILDWFQSPAASNATVQADADDAEMKSLLEKIHKPREGAVRMLSPSMGPVQSPMGWTISQDCTVDTSSGTLTSGCMQGESLRPIDLAPETWEDMVKANETIVTSGELPGHRSPFQGGKKGPKNKTADIVERRKHWKHFLKYLAERKEPIDVVVDGANVGYFDQNFLGAPKHVSYVQIDWVIDTLKKQGKSVLLVMHSRHFDSKLLPPKFRPLVNKWKQDGVLYRTPPGMNDDWFWMHIALTRPGTLMVTNDQLRDHHFQLMGPRCFLRWRERHQVFFDFGEPGDRKVRFTYPDPYSRRAQRVADGLVVPLPKRGDENRFLDGSLVVKEGAPEAETYLCIRPKA